MALDVRSAMLRLLGWITCPFASHIVSFVRSLSGLGMMVRSQFRAPVPDAQSHFEEPQESGEFRIFRRSNIPDWQINGISLQSAVDGRRAPVPETRSVWYDRQSTCALEVDVAAAGILNPKRFNALQQSLHGTSEFRNVPSLAAIWEVGCCCYMKQRCHVSPRFTLLFVYAPIYVGRTASTHPQG